MAGEIAALKYGESPGYSCPGCGVYRDGTLNDCTECGEPSEYATCENCGVRLTRIGEDMLAFPCVACGYDPDEELDEDDD